MPVIIQSDGAMQEHFRPHKWMLWLHAAHRLEFDQCYKSVLCIPLYLLIICLRWSYLLSLVYEKHVLESF